MKALIERIKTWWREVERRQLHRRVRLYYEAGHASRGATFAHFPLRRRIRLYYEAGGEHPDEEWLVDPTLLTNRYYHRPL